MLVMILFFLELFKQNIPFYGLYDIILLNIFEVLISIYF